MREAQEANTVGASLPTMTPAKRRKDLESPNGTFFTLSDAVSLLKDKILVMMGHVKTLGVGSSVASRAKEPEPNLFGRPPNPRGSLDHIKCDGRGIPIHPYGNGG